MNNPLTLDFLPDPMLMQVYMGSQYAPPMFVGQLRFLLTSRGIVVQQAYPVPGTDGLQWAQVPMVQA